MAIHRNQVNETKLNHNAQLPFELRLKDFAMAMQDVYDFFHDVNVGLVERGLERLGVCPSNTKMAVFGGSKTPPRSPIVDPGAFYEVVF